MKTVIYVWYVEKNPLSSFFMEKFPEVGDPDIKNCLWPAQRPGM
jgi:hypothetical protein